MKDALRSVCQVDRACGRSVKTLVVAAAAVLCLGAPPLVKAEVSTEYLPWELQTFAIYTPSAPKIDGDLADWDMARASFRICGETARRHGIQDGSWDGDEDASAACALRWDEKNLYAAALVRDDHPVPATKTIKVWEGNVPKDAPWQHDSWMLYFETIGQPAGTGRYHPKRTWPSLTYPFIGITLATEAARNVFLPEGCEARTRITQTGYRLECRLPFSALGFDVRPGDRLRLGHILVDKDPDQWGQIGAFFGADYDARTWGQLRLVSAEGVGADLIVGRESYVAGQPVRIKCNADSLWGKGRIEAITIRGPADFRKRFAVGAALKKGFTASVLVSTSTVGWPIGEYEVNADVQGARTAGVQLQLVKEMAPLNPEMSAVQVIPSENDPRKELPFGPKETPKPNEVTPDSYLKFIRERAAAAINGARSTFLKGSDKNVGTAAEGLFFAAFLYSVDRRPEDARLTIELLKKANDLIEGGARGFSAWEIRKIHYANQWLFGSPYGDQFLAETKRALRKFMPDYTHFGHYGFKERGAMNRSMHVAWAAETVLHYIPDLPEADRWRDYIEAVWNDWYEHRDIAENSTNYDPIDLEVLIDWIPLRPDPQRIWSDPGVKALFERYMLRTLPLGTIPTHGDACPWNTNWHGWVAPFEVAAAQYRDGRFTWAAHRLFSYALRYVENIWSWAYIGQMGAVRLAAVYHRIDPKLKPVPPADDVRVTRRQRVEMLPARERKPDKVNLILHADRMPDKAVFTSGEEPDAFSAFFDLCGDAGHSLSTSPNLCALVDKGAVLLHDLGYYEKGPEYHNVIYLEDLEGVSTGGQERTTIVKTGDGKRAAYAEFEVQNYKGWPVTNTREVLFVKRGLMMLRDRVRFSRGFRVRLGPAFQLCSLGPRVGSHWVNTYIPLPYSRPLNDYVLGRWYNPPRDLLIYFPRHKDRRLELIGREAQKIKQLPVRARYCWSGLPKAGDEICFTSLLIPHDPALSPEALVKGVEVLIDTPEVTAVRIRTQDAAEYLILNGPAKELDVDGIVTDARQAYVRVRGRKADYVWAQEARRVEVAGEKVLSAGTAQAVEIETRSP